MVNKMWLLIECDDLMDPGRNEKQRIIIKDNNIDFEMYLGWFFISGKGQHFHPCTTGE